MAHLHNPGRWSEEIPLIVYTPPFLLGQYIFGSFEFHQLLLTGIALLIVFYFYRNTRVALLILSSAAISGGFASVLHTYHEVNMSQQSPRTVRILAEVKAAIRRRRTGEVELPIYVHRTIPGEEQASGIVRGNVLICKGQDLPWRNESASRPGEVRAFYVRLRSYRRRRDGQIKVFCKILAASKILKSEAKWTSRLREWIRERTRNLLGDNETTGVLRALLLGEKDTVSIKTDVAFKRLGISHLLVVSGYHLSIFFALSYLFFYRLSVFGVARGYALSARNCGAGAALVSTCFYTALCVPQPSLVRALASLAVVCFTAVLGQKARLAGSILFSLLIVSALWPMSFLEPGVQLTFCALFSIAIGRPIFASVLEGSAFFQYAALSALISLSTGLCTFFWFGEFSFLGILVNIFLTPVMAFLCCQIGMIGLFLFLLGIDPAGYILSGVWYMTLYGLGVIRFLAEFPFAAYPFG